MDVQTFLDNVEELTDLELAVLLSLVAQEHCLLSTDDTSLDDLASELSLIVSERFGLSYVVIEPEQQTSTDVFGEAILQEKQAFLSDDDDLQPGSLRARLASVNIRAASVTTREEPSLDNRAVVNVIIAKGFNFAHETVQAQMIEVIRRKRVFSKTTVHPVPKIFLFLPIVTDSTKDLRLNHHLNDRIFISHHHSPEDGFVNLEELEDTDHSDYGSGTSIHQTSTYSSGKKWRVDHSVSLFKSNH